MRGGIDQWREMIHPTDRDRVERQENRARKQRAAFDLEYRVLAKHGNYLWLLDRGFFLEDEHGRATRTLGLLQNISERHRSEQDLKDSREQLRALAASLQSIREEERTMIAREIHDELGQALTGMKMDASWLRRHTPEGEAGTHDKITGMIELIDSTIQTVRRIASELRPGVLDNLGIIAAIEWQAQEFEQRTGITCEVNANVESLDLEKSHSTALFRIFQETLTNVVRHANATRVGVRIEAGKHLMTMRIEDNG
jgi:signal transduction histidine kinase